MHELPLGADGVNVRVSLIDANHVHGAVMFVFQGFFGHVLYTSDFRYDPVMLNNPLLRQILCWEDLDEVYLDNTFCDPAAHFASREEVFQRVKLFLDKHPNHQILIGKKALFLDLDGLVNARALLLSP